jgi:hypothetical protein
MRFMIRSSRALGSGVLLAVLMSCRSTTPPAASGGSPGSSGNAPVNSGGAPNGEGGAPSSGGTPPATGGASNPGVVSTSSAAELAKKLGKPPNFLIGMGNDLNPDHSMDGAYTLGTTLDLHYAYLVAYLNADKSWGSWKDWNPDGSFINVLSDAADAKGVIPMYTLYSMAAVGDGNLSGLTDATFQKGYWSDVKLLFQRIAMFGKPAVVHLEPDFWAYAEQQSHEDPSSMAVNLHQGAPDCADLTEDLVGMGHCLVRLARMYAPKALVGFHASQWAAGDPTTISTFLKKVGADQADVVFADLLDRDAGCFEAGTDPVCMRGGTFYWDETNATSPNFHEYLAWAKGITSGVGRPMIWWQIPFGVPSTTRGGTIGHYRDNRVHYLFSHIQEFVDAGGLGATFGVGAEHQTFIDTDGGQFKTAVAAYYAHPVALP